jgi:hypothetical protein
MAAAAVDNSLNIQHLLLLYAYTYAKLRRYLQQLWIVV